MVWGGFPLFKFFYRKYEKKAKNFFLIYLFLLSYYKDIVIPKL